MELAAAALGDEADLTAGRASVLGVVVGSEDLDFLNGLQVSGADRSAVGTGSDADGAVVGDLQILSAGAVNGQAARGQAKAEAGKRAAADAWLQKGEEQRVPAVEHQLLDLLFFNGLANRGGFGLQLFGGGDDFHRFGELADSEVGVYGDGDVSVEFVVR